MYRINRTAAELARKAADDVSRTGLYQTFCLGSPYLPVKEGQARILPSIVVSISCNPTFHLNCNIVNSVVDNPLETECTLTRFFLDHKTVNGKKMIQTLIFFGFFLPLFLPILLIFSIFFTILSPFHPLCFLLSFFFSPFLLSFVLPSLHCYFLSYLLFSQARRKL